VRAKCRESEKFNEVGERERCGRMSSGNLVKYLIDNNIISMTPEETEWWLRDERQGRLMQILVIPWDELEVEALNISIYLGIDIGAGEMRELAKQLRLKADIAESKELGIYKEHTPWRSKLRHYRALNEVLEFDEEIWIELHQMPWESTRRARKRYKKLLKEAESL